MKKLKPNEQKLVGKWLLVNNKIVGDETCERIEELIDSYLTKLATDESGWDVLYQDPKDGRYWELTYPQSELHGGGPATLTCVSQEYAFQKYKLK
ncbi:MAG: hypothetical protein XU11_C0004G0073 [Candidatus Dadabacteria bacterium CSP1-2]|nr:MAG: hypothetical protein XU11_C0004G0073 [Candidatus Dadabacteria bacterium CSP1-2]